MKTILPHLWFDDQAEPAAKFYVSVFPKSKLGRVLRYGPSSSKASGRPVGSVLTVQFRILGRDFVALNGGPHYKLTPAFSLLVPCKTQKEIDRIWEKLSDGGEPGSCGWLTDRFGVSWQIVPEALAKMIANPRRSEAVMEAVLKMKRLDLAKLKEAYTCC